MSAAVPVIPAGAASAAAGAASAAAGAASAASAGATNMARLNGPFQEHSLGNLLNARSKAEARLRNARLAGTHNANRSMINAINRHIGFRRNQSRRIEAAAAERRRATHAARLAAEAANPMELASLPPPHISPSGTGSFYTSQFIERGTRPKQRRSRRNRRSSRRGTRRSRQ